MKLNLTVDQLTALLRILTRDAQAGHDDGRPIIEQLLVELRLTDFMSFLKTLHPGVAP